MTENELLSHVEDVREDCCQNERSALNKTEQMKPVREMHLRQNKGMLVCGAGDRYLDLY